MQQIKNIPINEIIDPKNPMRTDLDLPAVRELARSIARDGLINPITVRPAGELYEVVAGHRRFTACKLAGLREVSCVVRQLTDEEVVGVMVAENLQRLDVDPVDEALFLGRLIGEDATKIKEVAEKVHRSVQWVEDRLEILGYPDFLIAAIKEGKVKLGVAHWLGLIGNEYWQKTFLTSAITNGMSVLQARYAHDQWEMGILKDPSEFSPQSLEQARIEPRPAHAVCAACKGEAEAPNLQLLFCHIECPKKEAEPEAVPPESESSVPPAPPPHTATAAQQRQGSGAPTVGNV